MPAPKIAERSRSSVNSAPALAEILGRVMAVEKNKAVGSNLERGRWQMRLEEPVHTHFLQLGKVKSLATASRNGKKASQLLVGVEDGRRNAVFRVLDTILCYHIAVRMGIGNCNYNGHSIGKNGPNHLEVSTECDSLQTENCCGPFQTVTWWEGKGVGYHLESRQPQMSY